MYTYCTCTVLYVGLILVRAELTGFASQSAKNLPVHGRRFPRARLDPTHAPWARRRNHSPRYGGAPCTLKRGMLCAASSRGCCSDCCCCQQPPRHTNDHFSQDHRAAPREETRAKRNQRARSSCDELPHSSWTSGDATRFA